jgi:hypothetical protein
MGALRARKSPLVLHRLANPGSLPSVEGEVFTATEASKRLAEFFDALMIRIEVSMGRRKGSLARQAVDKMLNYFTQGAGKDADVRGLTVRAKPGEGGETDPIDFIEEMLTVKDTVELPEANPDAHYAIRRAFVKQCFSAKYEYISEVYGTP